MEVALRLQFWIRVDERRPKIMQFWMRVSERYPKTMKIWTRVNGSRPAIMILDGGEWQSSENCVNLNEDEFVM